MALKRFSIDLASLSAGRIVQTVAAFLALPIVARLLGPHEYGLVAVAMSFVMCTIYMADAGMGQSLVRTPASERTTWSSAFWMISGFGGVLSLLLVAISFAAPLVFGEPRLQGLLLGLSVVPLIVSAIAAPTVGPSPFTRLKTPFGTPASCMISAKTRPLSGAISEGLSTIVQPAASAGATLQTI